MEVIINDLLDLKKYMKVNIDQKEIIFRFDEDVVFNCSLPSKNYFNYFIEDNIKDYTINLEGRCITFNYYVEIDNIYANRLVSRDTLICKFLNVIGDTQGGYISTDMFIGHKIEANTFAVRKICAKQIKIAFLSIIKEDQRSNDYYYIKASGINNIR